MNAPEPIPAVVMLPTGQIVKSPTNPRKHLNEAALQELATSIKEQGVLQPILVRKWEVGMHLPPKKVFGDMAGMHEIVAGERRWRAATLAGLAEIPAIVRELTDVQVLEIQVIENLQREDVHPIEEAEGYERLMKGAGYNADTLGEKVGKSRAYIYARLKLLDLCPEAREAFFEGKLDASTALLVARIPGKVLQKKAVKELVNGYGGPLSYRSAKDHVRRNFMLRLAEATFKPADAALVPAAGSCKECPKRTGNNPDLFGDVDDADVCTDPKCFEDKRQAHFLKLKENAEKKGVKVIEGEAARKLMPYGTHSLGGGYVPLDNTCEDDPEHRTYRQILGKEAPVAAIIETNPTYESKRPLIEVAQQKTLAEALKKAGIVPEPTKDDADAKKRKAVREKEEAAIQIEETWRARLFQAVREKFGARFAVTKLLAPEELTLIAIALFERAVEWGGEYELLMATWGHPVKEDLDDQDQIDAFTRHIATLDAPALCLFLTDLALIGETDVPRWAFLNSNEKPERLLAEAKRLGIDAAALKKAVETERKTAAKTESKAKNPAKSASPPTSAAQAQEESAAKPAAPAKAKSTAKKPAAKKPKGKADPAPASPANEPAAPVKTTQLDPKAAWPFPTGSRP